MIYQLHSRAGDGGFENALITDKVGVDATYTPNFSCVWQRQKAIASDSNDKLIYSDVERDGSGRLIRNMYIRSSCVCPTRVCGKTYGERIVVCGLIWRGLP